MRTIQLKQAGGVENLVYTEVSKPAIQDHEVLVQVKAISINPVDVKTRAGFGMWGRMKDISPLVLGWDIAGVVAEAGANSDWKAGDKVFGMVNFPGHGQAYSEYVVAPSDQLARVPENISYEEAAAATLAALTAWQAITHTMQLKAGQRILVHAAAGGVGHFAVQIAKQLGAFVIATSSEKNRDFILELGADQHIDYTSEIFETAIEPVDFVLDTVGGEILKRSLDVLKKGGQVISIPTGIPAEIAQLAEDKGVHAQFILVASNGHDMQQIAELLSKGIIRAKVATVFPFEAMQEAHLSVESGRTVGKVIVSVP